MKSAELASQCKKLSDLFAKTTAATKSNIEIQGHWAKYLCVLVAGFIENGLREVYSEYCQKCANTEVSSFCRVVLSKMQNPKSSKFLEVSGYFSKKWRNDLEIFLDNDGRKEAINSIMTNRHLIVHGKNTSIGLASVNDYFKKSVEVIEYIEKQCVKK